MDVEQLKTDLRDGTIDGARLIDLIAMQQRQLERFQRRIEELEKKLSGKPTPRLDESYSLDAEERRRAKKAGQDKRKKAKPGRKGRISSEEKLKLAVRIEEVYPDRIDPEQCTLSHKSPVWRFENGAAVLVAYHVYRGGRNQFGKIPGRLGRSEFGIEIIIAIAYQVFILGLSFDKVCALMKFFTNLKLSKGQADSLMNQLARHWESEFDTLCTLLANSAVVHADETGWSINSVWAFLSESVRVLFFGVHKDGETLKTILNPETFAGVIVSDDAAVYANFTKAQKCWAHLIRKAIKLKLQDPENRQYQTFAESLLTIYHKACRIKRDGRFSDAGRAGKVTELDDELVQLCGPRWSDDSPAADDLEDDYRRLVNEVMRLMVRQELFVFVRESAVDGTNNEAERTLRGSSQARKTGRTSKTLRGARRQSIVHSVLESLRIPLPEFTLGSVVTEVLRWSRVGRSCFFDLAQQQGLSPRPTSILDQVAPLPT